SNSRPSLSGASPNSDVSQAERAASAAAMRPALRASTERRYGSGEAASGAPISSRNRAVSSPAALAAAHRRDSGKYQRLRPNRPAWSTHGLASSAPSGERNSTSIGQLRTLDFAWPRDGLGSIIAT